jgi:hypothetical protein
MSFEFRIAFEKALGPVFGPGGRRSVSLGVTGKLKSWKAGKLDARWQMRRKARVRRN